MFHTLHNCPNKIIGRTEWPDDLMVLRKFGRIPEKYADPESRDQHALKNLEKGQFYVAGDFVAKDTLVKVGPVETKHLGSTPEIIPPAPKELKEVLAQLSEKLPTIIQEKLAPAVPKVAEIEARLREKFEAQWQARLSRKEKELSGVKNRLESKYETEIADLKRRLEEAARHAAVKGPVTDLLSHPLIQKNLEKLNAKQRSLIELLEAKGAQDPEHCSLFLEIGPKNVPDFVYKINSRIPKLIENLQGRYASRLAKLFPVTEEAKAEATELDQLRKEMAALQHTNVILCQQLEEEKRERTRLAHEVLEITRQKKKVEVAEKTRETPEPQPASHTEGPTSRPTAAESAIPVEVTLRRTLTSLNVAVNKEILDIDESSWEGKILARGLEGFFQEPKGIGKIMTELVRRYNVGDSGGNRTTVNDRLAMLVSKGILDRKQEAGQWVYSATPEFSERVKNSG